MKHEIVGVMGGAKSRTLGEGNRPIPYRSPDQTVADNPSLMAYTLVGYTLGNPTPL